MGEPVMKRAWGDGVEIQLNVWEGAGKNVLCVHGLTANCRCFDIIADSISPDHTFWAMDIRGRGFSDKPSSGYSIENHCKDIIALLDDISVEKVVLMGHSLGAFISLGFGAMYPDRVDRIILMDGGGKLSEAQMNKVLSGIKPAIDRLGQVFPSFEAYIDLLMQAPYFKTWSPAIENYFQYEAEEVTGGIRSRVQPENIQEEIVNLGKVDVAEFYPEISCPVLILRATQGMLADDDLLLPQDVVENMVTDISNAYYVNIENSNHYSIVFDPNTERDTAIRSFLDR